MRSKSSPAERNLKKLVFKGKKQLSCALMNGQELNRDICDEVMRASNLGRGVATIKGMKTKKDASWEEWQIVQSDWNIKCQAHRRHSINFF